MMLHMSEKYQLLVFDWDGTLMDSAAHIVAAMNAAIADIGLPQLPYHTISNIIGLGLQEAINTLLPDLPPAAHERVVARYRQHYMAPEIACSQLFAGAEQCLRTLHTEGYLLAVATGKGRTGLQRVLSDTGLMPLFHASRCADETCSKPDPQMLHEIMDELAVSPARTLMIGDTEYDLAMARNAGVDSIGVAYGVHENERLLRHQPLAILHDIGELPGWLAGVRSTAAYRHQNLPDQLEKT